ncbi:hypothetical protein JZO78_02765 [Enterococcus ureilyticus]|uniref:pre-toxin TG domain-containing protein n=1 Tax=Enterococcus ureilyticus TaxID=1131292 RepID=UPI001A923F13|nr:pre-toxin TG domain-containing protein [Enterococcus ureilyticus]MBO0445259.1 hypothetical protein [Enterococcus ureilyticus]
MKKLGIALTNMAGEMTGMYSLYRLFTGTDPVTGSKVSRLEAGLWVALLLLPQAKMVEAVKTLRAGDRALAGAALTEADLMILSKAGYFDDVAKINKIEKVSGAGVPKNSANSAQYQKYKNELMKGDILENSKPIISGSDLKDPKVISELTKNGSSMSDWAKMESTYSYETSMGKGKIHYYHNLKTGEISFYDVKMKVPIPKDLKIREGLTDDFWIIDLDNNFILKGVR